MASNKTHAKKIGINPEDYNYELEVADEGTLLKFWIPILWAKFSASAEFKELLLSTGDAYLLEFDRFAASLDRVFWGGMDMDRIIKGRNFMGECLMLVRERLRAEENN